MPEVTPERKPKLVPFTGKGGFMVITLTLIYPVYKLSYNKISYFIDLQKIFEILIWSYIRIKIHSVHLSIACYGNHKKHFLFNIVNFPYMFFQVLANDTDWWFVSKFLSVQCFLCNL